MSVGERVSILGDFRKVLQDFLAPELRELSANLRSRADGQREMEVRLLRGIQKSEEKILLMLKLSEVTGRLKQVTRENEELKREKTQ